MITKKLGMLVFAMAALTSGAGASAQNGDWGAWSYFARQNGVDVFYRTRADEDYVHVQWKCKNTTDLRKSCSIGNGRDKQYTCYRYGSNVGPAKAMGEMDYMEPRREVVFASEPICKGRGATTAMPSLTQVNVAND